jgi:guanylate kinase
MDVTHKSSGKLFVITAPSGAGKTSLIDAIMRDDPTLKVSVSYTTRAPRRGEQNGVDYHFVDDGTFLAMKQRDEFLESAEVHGYRYGTSKQVITDALKRGEDLILEIDWQGAQQVRKAQADCTSVFILPPSRIELETRLRNRKTDSNEVIERRLLDAVADMSHYAEFDYVIVNDDFEAAVAQLLAILRGGGTEYDAKRPALKPLLADLLA